ncbi:hypothetical protein D5086_019775 [Populus alba]|uniref:Uncharacterized protein n=1 Tax=Populus alba TaxID=43335 RepID=A0ACC4BJR4_POPAL
MNLTLATSLLHLKTPSSFNSPSLLHFTTVKSHKSTSIPPLKIPKASSPSSSNDTFKNPLTQTLKTLSKTAILIGVTASMAGKFPALPAKAETPAALTEQNPTLEEEEEGIEKHQNQNQSDASTPLEAFLESNAEAIESLKSLLQQKLEKGQDDDALNILKHLVSAQPEVTEWKFLMARLLNEMCRVQDARNVFEEILVANPLSFEALFENALLMERSGEGDAVIRRLREALDIAEEENKVKEARDVRLIMAQIQFLQKNVEEALESYQELSKEDPKDFRPYFCRGMIYSLLDRNEEAKEQFAKYRELSPKKFEFCGNNDFENSAALQIEKEDIGFLGNHPQFHLVKLAKRFPLVLYNDNAMGALRPPIFGMATLWWTFWRFKSAGVNQKICTQRLRDTAVGRALTLTMQENLASSTELRAIPVRLHDIKALNMGDTWPLKFAMFNGDEM